MTTEHLPIDPEVSRYISNLTDYLMDMINMDNYQASVDAIIDIRETIKCIDPGVI